MTQVARTNRIFNRAMQDPSYIENDFLRKITAIIEENLSNENFGVSELAREAGMSRSNLLRKVKISHQFIGEPFYQAGAS